MRLVHLEHCLDINWLTVETGVCCAGLCCLGNFKACRERVDLFHATVCDVCLLNCAQTALESLALTELFTTAGSGLDFHSLDVSFCFPSSPGSFPDASSPSDLSSGSLSQFMTQGKSGNNYPPSSTPPKPGSQLDSMLGSLQSDLNKLGVATVAKGVCGACKKPIAGQVSLERQVPLGSVEPRPGGLF